MARPSDGGKGSDRRRENGDAYRQNHDLIDWGRKPSQPTQPPKPAQPQSNWAWLRTNHDE